MEELKSYWQTPSIAHFCYLFRDGLKLPKFDIEELELALLCPIPTETPVGSDASDYLPTREEEENLIVKISVILLRGYFNHHSIGKDNWEQYFRKLFSILWVGREGQKSPFLVDDFDEEGNPVVKIVSFNDLPLRTKVDTLYHLCEYRLYADDSQNLIAHLVEDELRVEPLAKDNKGNQYWYFFGTRLYRENPTAVANVEKTLAALKRAFKPKKVVPKKIVVVKEPPKKKPRKEPIPGERSSQRERKPVTPLNGTAKANVTSTPKKSIVNSSLDKDKETEAVHDNSTSCGVPLDKLKEAWTLICETEEDWINLTDSFRKSKLAAEIEFYNVLSNNFLPRITEIFREKEKLREKETKKKLIELLPRRLSSRVQIKKLEKEEEDKKRQEEFEERKRRGAEAGERRKREEDRRKQEDIKKQREFRAQQRLVVLEDTANQAARRRITNNSAMNSSESEDTSDMFNAHDNQDDATVQASNGWIVSDTVENDEEISKDEFYNALEKIIASINSNRDAWPFKEAVDESTAPMYYQVIEEPMDLSAIEKKINDRTYDNLREVERDFKRMVNNCETFNGPKNGYTLMAYAVWKHFRKTVKRFMNRDLVEDEQTAFLYPPKTRAFSVPAAALEARKKKSLKKHRKGMKALEVLAQAAEIAVKDTSSRGSSIAGSSPRSIASSDERTTDFVVYDELDNSHSTTTGPISGEVLARYLYNASNIHCPDLIAFYIASNDNLTFRSLSDWSDSLKQSGNTIILPQHAVVLNSSGQSSQSSSSNEMQTNEEGFVTLQVVAKEKISESSSVDLLNGNTHDNVNGNMPRHGKRIVIKLSRCRDSGTTWKPVRIIPSESPSLEPIAEDDQNCKANNNRMFLDD